MSSLRLILRSLQFHLRINLAVALGVAAATAVLTGALVVGDSVRGSLQHLALDRLGKIDALLVTDRFFRSELADELAAAPGFSQNYSAALPAVVVLGTVENPTAEHKPRAGDVTVIGSDERFWTLGAAGLAEVPWPLRGEVVLNQPLADKLSAKPGEDVILRIGSVSQIPADSPLGRKTETIRNQRLTVKAIIPAESLGRFGLRPTQQTPLDAFVAAETLQAALDQPHLVNAIFVAGRDGRAPDAVDPEALQSLLRPTLADYGFPIDRTKLGYLRFTSKRMMVEPAAEAAVKQAFADAKPLAALTYLANSITLGDRVIPYSTIAALDFSREPPLGPFINSDGDKLPPLGPGEIALNAWSAEDLGAKLGDTIELTYFEPESTHGQVQERTAKFTLAGVVAMEGAGADRQLTPDLPGVTDQLSIGDWDPPFPFEAGRVRKKDEQYWDDFRTTPKAYISLADGQKLWGSRFGQATSLRWAEAARGEGGTGGEGLGARENTNPVNATSNSADLAEQAVAKLKLDPKKFGFELVPIKAQALAAATGTTPFNLLFLGFSFFIMAAALMLVALLFRLGMQQRAAEIGVLSATGLRRRQIALLLCSEGFVVAMIGGALGVVAGVAYAWLMLAGLKSPTFWLQAIRTPFLQLHINPPSLLIGYISGVAVSLLTILWTLRQLKHLSVRRLLGGQWDEPLALAKSHSTRLGARVAWAMAALAVVLGLAALKLGGEAQAGAFFGSGALVLAAAMTLLWAHLRAGETRSMVATSQYPLGSLAMRNGARNPSRSVLTVGLVAAASFLIVAISAFQLDPSAEGRGKDSGSGGFALIARTDQPIYQDLNTAAGRDQLGISADASAAWSKCHTLPLRVQAGDDASCLNLYQPKQPRALAISHDLVVRGGFAWAGSAARDDAERANPWLLLEQPLEAEADGVPVAPVVLDMNTALYSLHLWKGVGETFDIEDARGEKLQLKVVGLLKNSIFQGDLLLDEQTFRRHFPNVSGYRMFLVDAPESATNDVIKTLEEPLSDYGFAAERSVDRLAELLAVQNTYLATFQSLGGLGLLLGTFGLATVQLRSVLERRGELALMRAAGFRRRLLARLVLIENALLLGGGLAIGTLAALVAVLPHLLGGGASIPWLSLVATLTLVLVVGLLAGLAAVRATLRAELLPALRGE